MPGGLSRSKYLVVMDLSGNGAYHPSNIIEVEGITTDEDRILFASPLTQAFPATNTSQEFAVWVKRTSDRATSDVFHFAIEDIAIPADLAGYATTALEVVLKSLYDTSDNPLLALGAPSIQPGLSAVSAKNLDLDTTLSDVQAAAMLQSVLGFSLADWAAANRPRSAGLLSDSPPAGREPILALGSTPSSTKRWCLAPSQRLCEVFSERMDCIGDAMLSDRLASHCAEGFGEDLVDAWQDQTEKLTTWLPVLRQIGGKITRNLISPRAIERLHINNAVLKQVNAVGKLNRAWDELSSGIDDSATHLAGGLPTRQGLTSNYENVLAIGQEFVQNTPELIQEAERDAAGQDLGDDERDAFWTIVNESDRQRREVEAFDELEDVYTGEEEPSAAIIGGDPGHGFALGPSCEYGYDEFPIDDDTSTCVFASLVEPNCYAGSRRVRNPDLGPERDNICLYYSLDFFQADGMCRENYARVHYQGRWTCRWDELEAHQPPWYTLRKEENGGGDDHRHFGVSCVDFRFHRSDCSSDFGPPGTEIQIVVLTNRCGREVQGLISYRAPPEFVDPILGAWTNHRFHGVSPGEEIQSHSGFCLGPQRTLPLVTCAHFSFEEYSDNCPDL